MLEVVYLVFNEGYAASAGDDWVRQDLCEEALRLGRILAELEVHGLIALLEQIEDEPALASYHLLPSVRDDLLEKAGRQEEAAAEFQRAAEMTSNEKEREILLSRAARPRA